MSSRLSLIVLGRLTSHDYQQEQELWQEVQQHQIRDNATMQNNDKRLAAELQKHILAGAVGCP
eukprot:473223-Amphidinium_carterae.1